MGMFQNIKTEGVMLFIALFIGLFAMLSGLLKTWIPSLGSIKVGLFFFVIALVFVFWIVYIILAKKYAFDRVSFVVMVLALVIVGGFLYFVLKQYPDALGGLFSVWNPDTIAQDFNSLIP